MPNNAPSPVDKENDLRIANERFVASMDRLTANREEVVTTAIPALNLRRLESPSEQTSYVHEPSLCLVAQGAKRVTLGSEQFAYDAAHYLIASVDLPVLAQITEASPEKPYLGLMFKLDPRMISQLILDGGLAMPRPQQTILGIAVCRLTAPLLGAFQRLLDVLDQPEDIPVLAPMIQREIHYRLLMGEQGARLRQMGTVGSQSNQLAKAIDWLKRNYAEPLRVEDLAAQARMSIPTFHRHFRDLTTMSPIQFQKRIRLHEARRVMFAERLDASSAALQVGYESPTQFNREYSRLFGAPPLRDIKSLRSRTTGNPVTDSA